MALNSLTAVGKLVKTYGNSWLSCFGVLVGRFRDSLLCFFVTRRVGTIRRHQLQLPTAEAVCLSSNSP